MLITISIWGIHLRQNQRQSRWLFIDSLVSCYIWRVNSHSMRLSTDRSRSRQSIHIHLFFSLTIAWQIRMLPKTLYVSIRLAAFRRSKSIKQRYMGQQHFASLSNKIWIENRIEKGQMFSATEDKNAQETLERMWRAWNRKAPVNATTVVVLQQQPAY